MKYQRSTQLLFFTRLFLYISAFLIPSFHPAIAVAYDRPGWWLWFFVVPGEMIISFYLTPPHMKLITWLATASGFLFVSTIIFSTLGGNPFLFIVAGGGAFLLTFLVFRTGERGYSVAIVEQFFLVFIYYKLLSFSRSSEATAIESSGFTQILMAFTVCAFLLHGTVLYFSAFSSRIKRRRSKEIFIFGIIALPLVLLFGLVLPPDFIKHSVVLNRFGPEPEPEPIPIDIEGDWIENGNLRGSGEMNQQKGEYQEDFWNRILRRGKGKGKDSARMQGRLEGIPSDRWLSEGKGEGEGGEQKQYAVMIVASPLEPLYAAEGYYGKFDPVKGFMLSDNFQLNELTYIRLLDSWEQKEIPEDAKRYPFETFYLSTLSYRAIAYLPQRVEPTVLNKKYHPFDFSYRAVSLISVSDPRDWQFSGELSDAEKNNLSGYLEVNLSPEVKTQFESYLKEIIKDKNGFFEKIFAIFNGFSSFYYEIGFTDDVSVANIEDFLFRRKKGDCTEFSNTAALLARMAGIPSRVVTGYLASKNLQAPAHRHGLKLLRDVIEPLKQFPFEELYLVTTAHHHSWVQIYIPEYGWVDTDPTSFAIPPRGSGNPNSMNVVIPIINIEENRVPFRFPWILAGQILLLLVAGAFITLYILRYGKEFSLELLATKRKKDRRSLNAIYYLLLMKLAAGGYSLKEPHQTAIEYSQKILQLKRFSMIYTNLRYREFFLPGEKEKLWEELHRSYNEIILNFYKKPGLKNAFKRTFNLRGLFYIF